MSDKAKSIKAEVTVAGETRYLTRMSATIGMGSQAWPRVELVTHSPKDAYTKAESLGTADVCSDMGKRQKALFEERSPDVEVKIQIHGGKDVEEFNFKGLLSGPTYAFSPYMVTLADMCVAEYAQVDALSYAIYSLNPSKAPQEAKPDLYSTGTICALMNAVQGKLRTDFKPDHRSGSADQEYTKAQHQVNEKYAHFFEQLLTNSDSEESFGWTKVLDKLKLYDINLRKAISTIFAQSSGPFSNVIDRIAETFMCAYVPGWGNIGRFLNKYNLLSNKKDLTVDVVQLSITASSGFGLLPTGYVGVSSPYLIPSMAPQEPARHFVVYPKESAQSGKGIMYQTMGPCWISDTLAKEKIRPPELKREKGVDTADAKQEVKEIKANEKQETEGALTILEEWGKAQYIDKALARSVVQLLIPLTFSPEIQLGTYYSVKTDKGAELFTGVLAQIAHNLTTEGGNPQATTMLAFTHVQLPGFTLPGL